VPFAFKVLAVNVALVIERAPLMVVVTAGVKVPPVIVKFP